VTNPLIHLAGETFLASDVVQVITTPDRSIWVLRSGKQISIGIPVADMPYPSEPPQVQIDVAQ
jgi:hypothetical protein